MGKIDFVTASVHVSEELSNARGCGGCWGIYSKKNIVGLGGYATMTEVGGEGWGGEGCALGLAEVLAIILGEGGINGVDVVEAFPCGGRVFGVCVRVGRYLNVI